ncbi:MAG: hypothetical protein Q9194_007026, partial [Teloschistes cf. exilis]
MADTQSLTVTLYVQAQRALDDPFSLTSALIVVVFFLVSSSAIQSYNKRQRLIPGVPIVGIDERGSVKAARKRFVHDAKGLLQEGYEMAGGGLFYVPSPLGERLMLSREYAEELKSAPIDKVDFVATFQELSGPSVTVRPRKESSNALTLMYLDWTEVAVAEKFTQLVGRVSSRMFGGKQLSQNTEWVNTTITFAVDGFIGAQKIKKYPRILRPLAARFIPEIAKIKNHYEFARNLLIPIMQERKRTGEKPMDLLQWMMDNAKGPEETDEAFIADIMLKVSFAAIHTSAAAPTQLIYDLCQIPEIVAPLREEMQAALLETSGRWNKQAFNKMPKMDSFLKESQRFNPLLL